MKMKSLHIYGFGRFENQFIDFESENAQVILGENESGKSTLMAFIEYMLYGFPKRSEKRLRYEPKTTQAYGGRLKCETDMHGTLTIERKGGASGSVHLFKEDGSEAEVSLLQQILAEVNQQTFRNVFSFNLDGLQKVGEIKSEQLGEYLFNAGLTGAQQLNTISSRLEEEQNKLFKPNGKNPLLNQKMEKLVELERQVKQWGSKLEEYNQMKSKLEQKRLELHEKEKQRSEWQKEVSEFQHFQSILPLLEKKNTTNRQLADLPQATPFPEEGIERFRMLKERHMELAGEKKHVEEMIEQVFQAKKELLVDSTLLEKEDEIHELETAYTLYKVRQTDLDRLYERITYAEQEIEEDREVIGTDWTENRIRSANTDLVTKQQLVTILKKLDGLLNDQKRLDQDLENSRVQLEENENQLSRVDERLLPDHEIRSYKEQLKQITTQSPQYMQEQLTRLKQMQKLQAQSSLHRVMIWALIGLGILLSVFWMMNGDYVTGLIIGISLTGTGVILNSKGNASDKDVVDKQIQQMEKEISRHSYDGREEESLEKTLLEQQQLSVQADHLKQQTIDLEKQYQQIARKYDKWELDFHETKEQLDDWRSGFDMPGHIPDDMLLELFDRLDRLKRRYSEWRKLKKEYEQLQSQSDYFVMKLQQLSEMTIEDRESIEREMELLSTKLKSELENDLQRKELSREHDELLKRLDSLNKKISHYEAESQKLFSYAQVTNEEDFWIKGKANEKYQKLMEQMQMVQVQLEQSSSTELVEELGERRLTSEQTKEHIDELKMAIDQADEWIEQLRDQCSQLQANISHLEEDGSYSHQLHSFEVAKSEFNEQAKHWAILRTAQHALDVAKRNYQAERQPKVIRRAGEYFSKLTEGRYTGLIAPKEEESFLIERSDSIIFSPEELSRATMEQLYLSLRFALAEEYEANGRFPLIMDDILVNFDEKRRLLASQLIQSIAKERQILYFTCHESTADSLSTKPIRLPSANTLQHQSF